LIDFRVNDRNLHDVASVRLHGAENEGWKANSYCGYAVDWAFDHMGALMATSNSSTFGQSNSSRQDR